MALNNLHNEPEVLQRIAEGDQVAFTEFFHIYSTPLSILAARILQNDFAKDEILQEVFLKVWLNRDTLPSVENLNAWLKKITINQSLEYLRKARRYENRLAALKSTETPQNDAIHKISVNEIQALVNQAIEKMPLQRRKIYELSRIQGLTSQEISEQLKVSEGYVRNSISAALGTIRAALPDYLQLPSIIFSLFFLKG